ncbi:MAG TPA: BlaI/MecI/CopY family transcriptional regulator [Planctomycetota bacterium]|nr:BlaI/MecI/CopY family transcriptional regulator [Planctomycetota bacterium]
MSKIALTDAEWKVMEVLWTRSPATARDVHDALAPETAWAYTTVKTLLDRLEEKGAVAAEMRRNAAHYLPTVTRDEGRRGALRALLDKAFGGAVAPLVHHLLREETLSRKDREELARLLKEPAKKESAR